MPPMATATTTDSVATRRFAVACGVLSQYVKAAKPVPTMPTSPPSDAAHVGAAQEPDGRPSAEGAQQLTIFYGGRVVVLDGCTPARAADLIRYATVAGSPVPTTLVDMPIARKASLQRFLSKRKDRSAADVAGRWEETAPAKKGKTGASSWLALGSLGDMHAQ